MRFEYFRADNLKSNEYFRVGAQIQDRAQQVQFCHLLWCGCHYLAGVPIIGDGDGGHGRW